MRCWITHNVALVRVSKNSSSSYSPVRGPTSGTVSPVSQTDRGKSTWNTSKRWAAQNNSFNYYYKVSEGVASLWGWFLSGFCQKPEHWEEVKWKERKEKKGKEKRRKWKKEMEKAREKIKKPEHLKEVKWKKRERKREQKRKSERKWKERKREGKERRKQRKKGRK